MSTPVVSRKLTRRVDRSYRAISVKQSSQVSTTAEQDFSGLIVYS